MSPIWILLTLLPILGGAVRFNCKGRILGAYYADAKSGCKAFHVCVRVAGGGIRDFRFFCPPGTLFHTEAQTCTDWGDDDPLACPADLYDGQFDLYKIGSGYDTRKLSSSGNREDEAEFGLQRAETGDRRLSQNNAASNGPASDLRAAHSSDFFSGQRDRGRDETAPPAPPAPAPASASTPYPRQSFRRATTQRATTTTTQYTPAPTFPPQSSSPPQYEVSKRKLVRKRPLYKTTAAPTTSFLQNTPPQNQYSEPQQQQYQPQQHRSQQYQPQKQQQQPQQQTQQQQPQQQQPQQQQPQQQQQQPQQQYFNRRNLPQNRQSPPTLPPNVPPQYNDYKDEYVEVSRVTPKQNRYFSSNPSSGAFSQTTPAAQFNNKDGLVELYNYEAQSTPGLNAQNDNRPFKVRNSFSVDDVPREPDFARTKNLNNNFNKNVRAPTTTVDYNISSRGAITSTPAYKNYNSVSYESDKNNFIPFSKQNYFNSPTTTPPTTTIYTTARSDPSLNLNTVAYNTNNAFHTQSNFADNGEDDGQYRPPQGEDDGQYRPELYDRELLTGAHSLNIAASGNRLPEDQKPRGKTQPPPKHSHTAVPRPFRPAPTSNAPATESTRAVETYPTTVRPVVKTQRTFDYYQTYTTTSRPSDIPEAINHEPARQTTTTAPRSPDTRPTTPAPRPSTRPPHLANPPKNKEDSSYDYAYYDSDPGFSEYDHIEEFGRTKTRA